MNNHIVIAGAGAVGQNAAQYCLGKNLADVVLLDIEEDMARGKALDLNHAAPHLGHSRTAYGGNDYSMCEGAKVLVIAAGLPRLPGMSRDDLLQKNIAIVSEIVEKALKYAPDAIIVMVTNPLDILTYTVKKKFALPASRILGMSGSLDTARMRFAIAEALGVPTSSVKTLVLGEHGDTMVPLPRLATVSGIPVSQLLSSEQIAEVVTKTTTGGAMVVNLMKRSASISPGVAISTIVEAIMHNTREIVPCSVYLDGQFGARDLCMCAPARIGANGVEEVFTFALEADEQAALDKSIAKIRAGLDSLAL